MAKDEKVSCPKCLGILETKEVGEMEGSAISIDQCPMCKGIWFDKDELDQVLKLKMPFDDEEAEEHFRQDTVGDYFDLKKTNCPRCKTELSRVKSAQDSRVVVDYCMDCGGAWLDGGEIRLLLRGGPIRRAINFIFNKINEKLREAKANRGNAASGTT
jgi:Zn-finger nucleic acid-binding protein